jgi:hypothetical protein
LLRRHLNSHPPTVLRGPFAGLCYPHSIADYDPGLLPKLLGTFEQELAPAIEEVIASAPSLVVNIGAAEGYYAVGLALRLPESHVVAFEMDSAAAARCVELAELNGVADRVRLKGLCTPAELASLDLEGALVVCDCEGCELSVIDPSSAPGLRQAELIVELHDFVDPSISRVIKDRFGGSGRVEIVGTAPRDPALVEELAGHTAAEAALAVDEHRPGPMEWAVVRPSDSRVTPQ